MKKPLRTKVKSAPLTEPWSIPWKINLYFNVSLQTLINLWRQKGEVNCTGHKTQQLVTAQQQVLLVWLASPHLFNLDNTTPTLFTHQQLQFEHIVCPLVTLLVYNNLNNCSLMFSVYRYTLNTLTLLQSLIFTDRLWWHWAKLQWPNKRVLCNLVLSPKK